MTSRRCSLEAVGDPSDEAHPLLAPKHPGDHLPVQPLLQQQPPGWALLVTLRRSRDSTSC